MVGLVDFRYEHDGLPLTARVDAEVDWQSTVYGEGLHAFAVPDVSAHNVDGAAYDPLLDHLSRLRATAFLAASSHGVPAR